jgi:multidrug resistance efflux pump
LCVFRKENIVLSKSLIISLLIVVTGFGAGALMLTAQAPHASESAHDHEHGEEAAEHEHEEARGPHRGSLLIDRDLQLEVTIFEAGIPPEFRIYPTTQGKPLPLEQLKLTAEVKRLGQSDRITFVTERDYLRGQQSVYEPHSFDVVFTGQWQGKTYTWQFTQEEGRLQVPPAMAERSGIRVAQAGPRALRTTLHFPGQIAQDQDKYVHMVAPIHGMAVEVLKHVGEPVQAGEVMAVVHSQEDLRLQHQLLVQKRDRARFEAERENTLNRNTQTLLQQLKSGKDPETIHQEMLKQPMGEAKGKILAAFSDVRSAKLSLNREVGLSRDQATSQVELQQAQRDYERALAGYLAAVEEALWQREQGGFVQRQAVQGVELELQALAQKFQALQIAPQAYKGQLARYVLKAPISGVITEKHVAVGEQISADTRVFVVSDLSVVWAELLVPDAQLSQVKLGQRVRVIAQNQQREAFGVISHNSPVVDAESRRAEAHAHIDNRDGFWRPGMFVQIEVLVDERKVPVAVAKKAIQSFRDWQVVFARFGDIFEARPLVLGAEDADWVEVKSGLKAGQTYALDNSFVLKAELGKSEASHDH